MIRNVVRAVFFSVACFQSTLLLAASCALPEWDRAELSSEAPDTTGFPVEVQPLATLTLPGGFERMAVSSSGTTVFHYPSDDGRVAFLAYETTEMAKLHQRTSAYELSSSIFNGSDAAGCEYLQALDLDRADYRVHISRGEGVDIYVFGEGKRQTFYMLDKRWPDLVLLGWFLNFSREQVMGIISSIELKS